MSQTPSLIGTEKAKEDFQISDKAMIKLDVMRMYFQNADYKNIANAPKVHIDTLEILYQWVIEP